jgi:hypothetical protein
MWTIDADMPAEQRDAIIADLHRAMSIPPREATPLPVAAKHRTVEPPVPPKPLTDLENLERLVDCLRIANETLAGIEGIGRMDVVLAYAAHREILITEIEIVSGRVQNKVGTR